MDSYEWVQAVLYEMRPHPIPFTEMVCGDTPADKNLKGLEKTGETTSAKIRLLTQTSVTVSTQGVFF